MSTTRTIDKQEGLRDAAGYGRIDDVRKYLNDGTVDVNGKGGCFGWTALHWASWNGHDNIGELLLDNGADIDALTYNETPLILACDKGCHASFTKLLLNRGCAVDAADDGRNTALHHACWRGFTQCVKELLARGADTNMKNNDGDTPLDVAKDSKNQAVIDLIMEHKKRPQQAPMNSTEDVKNDIVVEVVMSTPKADVSSDQPLEMLICQLTASNSELVKCVSNQSTTMVGHLSSKVSSIEREQDSMKIGMTQMQEGQKAMTRNLEQMNQSLQRLTGDHSIVSDVNADGGGGRIGHSKRRKKSVDSPLKKWVKAYINCFNLDKATAKHAMETVSDKFGTDMSDKKSEIMDLLREAMS